MRNLLLSVVVGALLLSAWPIHAEDNATTTLKVVQAQGVGADQASAMANGERSALDQCLNLYCKSEVVTANTELLSKNIDGKLDQLVAKCDVVSQSADAAGQTTLKLSVQVRMAQLEDTLGDLWEQLKIAGNPRIIVDIDPGENKAAADAAQSALTDRLVELGFKVLDAEQLKKTTQKTALKMLRDDQSDAAAALALQDCTDLVITGKVATHTEEVTTETTDDGNTNQVKAFSCQGTVTLRAIRVDTAQIIASPRGKATKADFSTEEAIDKTAEAAAQDWVTKSLPLLVRAIVDPCKEYTVLFTGCTMDDVSALDAQLTAMSTVRKTDLVAFDNGLANSSVQFQGPIKDLATALRTQHGVQVVVDGVANTTIRMHKKG